MKELFIRTITGVFFVCVLIFAITWNKYSVAGLFFIVSIIGLLEFFNLMSKAGFNPKKSFTISIGATIYFIIPMYSFKEFSFKYLLFIFPLLVILVGIELFRKKERLFTLNGKFQVISTFEFHPTVATFKASESVHMVYPRHPLKYFLFIIKINFAEL